MIYGANKELKWIERIGDFRKLFTHSVRNERFRRKIELKLKHYFGRYPFTFVRPLDLNKSTLKEDDRSRGKNFRNAFAYFLCAFGIEPMRLSNYSRYFSGLSVFVTFLGICTDRKSRRLLWFTTHAKEKNEGSDCESVWERGGERTSWTKNTLHGPHPLPRQISRFAPASSFLAILSACSTIE